MESPGCGQRGPYQHLQASSAGLPHALTGTEAHVHEFGIADDGNAAPIDGVQHKLAVQVRVAAGWHGVGRRGRGETQKVGDACTTNLPCRCAQLQGAEAQQGGAAQRS